MRQISQLPEKPSTFTSGGRRWWIAALLATLILVLAVLFLGGALAARLVASEIERRLGVPASIARGRVGLGRVRLSRLVVGERGSPPIATAEVIDVPFAAAWGGGTVRARRLRLHLERGEARDNLTPLLSRLSKRGGSAAGGGRGRRRLPALAVEDGALRFEDGVNGRSLLIAYFDAHLSPERVRVEARQVSGQVRLRGGESDPSFGAAALTAEAPLSGLRPSGLPRVQVTDGFLRVLPTLPLTGITGSVAPEVARPGRMGVRLAGSYGGARRSLWTAEGSLGPARTQAGGKIGGLEGALSLRAERFSLDKIADVLPASVLQPQETSIDAALDFAFSPERVSFTGNLEVVGLSLHHERLAAEPIFDLGFSVGVEGALVPARRRFELTRFEGRLRDLVGRMSGSLELAPGVFRHKDGSEMAALPRIEIQLQVPRVPCAKALISIPPPVVPTLQGFVLQGVFAADVSARIDYAALDDIELGGKVDIGGCRVVKAPIEVTRLGSPDSLVHVVGVPPRPGDPAPEDTLVFSIGPENPDFVPYDRISPHIVNAIMTTEDNGFFRHRGWVSPEFKTALRRNLEGGGFRFGASSITMQMVKNVLLAQEKTLSRKLQELFLVWYVEQQLSKERIFEIYLNAIEFGPRLYGIGAAARHYFGKEASDIGPLEAAFISSILPSPKRRYVQYCQGALSPKWDNYVRRILKRIHERGRLTDEEYQAASAQTFAFDVAERGMTEKQCLDWVKRITSLREPEPDVEGEAP